MSLVRPISHVVFDMDGVLLDTERFYTEVTREIVGRYGKEFDWSLKGNMIGRPAIDSARYLVAALELPLTPEEYLSERETMLERLLADARPMPGASELTAMLAQRRIPLAVATSSNRRLFALKTARHREWFERDFAAVVLGDDPRVRRGKPAPDIFLVAADELGADPRRCLVVEDAPAGVAAAHAAGMQVLAVPDAGMDRERFREAELVVDSLAAVSPALLGL
ncbi:MAG: HAD-IA family hydrolase [Myxococcales bacterium]|nr:HAD-IA family hydrolase [Myxococcales bacterium]